MAWKFLLDPTSRSGRVKTLSAALLSVFFNVPRQAQMAVSRTTRPFCAVNPLISIGVDQHLIKFVCNARSVFHKSDFAGSTMMFHAQAHGQQC
jgi:hypothetical protein